MALKLNITYTIDIYPDDDMENNLAVVHGILADLPDWGKGDVSLTREGDRSSANLLAPVNDKHYKHHKIPLSEIKLD